MSKPRPFEIIRGKGSPLVDEIHITGMYLDAYIAEAYFNVIELCVDICIACMGIKEGPVVDSIQLLSIAPLLERSAQQIREAVEGKMENV